LLGFVVIGTALIGDEKRNISENTPSRSNNQRFNSLKKNTK